MIDVRQREKNDFENKVVAKKTNICEHDIQIKMFDNTNYGYFISSFYGEFILQDNSTIKTINHFIKCENYIYCFVEEIIENKYDDIMWYIDDYTQKIHAKTVFQKQGDYYVLVDFISNIKEIDNELSVLKLIRIFGDYSEFLNVFECDKSFYITTCHALLFQKFNLDIPNFDKYDNNYDPVEKYSQEDRKIFIKKNYEQITRKSNK